MFRVGDYVMRINKHHNEISTGMVGEVMSVSDESARVRYAGFTSKLHDGYYNQLVCNLQLVERPFPVSRTDAADAMAYYGMSALEHQRKQLEQDRRNAEIRESLSLMPKSIIVECGPDIGMFIRDGMTSKQARSALDRGIPIGFDKALEAVLRKLPKMRACVPGPRTIRHHPAPPNFRGLDERRPEIMVWGLPT